MIFKKDDRVTKSPMWKYETAVGTIIRVGKDGSCFVKWDNINGEWYFNSEQVKEIKPLEVSDKDV